MAKGLLLILLLLGTISYGQVGQPQSPQYQSFQPIPIGQSYSPQQQQTSYQPFQSNNLYAPKTTTAADVERMANRNNPSYREQGDNRTDQQMNNDRIMQDLQNSPAYNPQLRNANSKHFHLTPTEELLNMFGSVTPAQLSEDYNSKEFADKTKPFTDALHKLKDMLSGKQPLSIAEAYYTMENAYGESYLTKSEFYSVLRQSCNFINAWMAQNGLNVNDNEAKHYAIQKFMSERLYTTALKQDKDKPQQIYIVMHDPFLYDFNNYTGEKDHRDFYVTKCLATGMGQCNSMATLYLCLAEGMGAKAYLAFAPQHALIKYRDKHGNMRNYEATSNWDITDKWYLDNLFISRKGQQSGIFLTPYNNKQIVANCILDLAFGYQRRHGAADGKFIIECIKAAKPYFPKNNNIELYITYSNMYGNQLGKVMKANRVYRVEDAAVHIPAAKALYEKWQANEAIIETLGYNNDPPGLYEEMMKHYEFRGREQQKLHLDGRKKHSLFTVVNK